MEYVNTIVRGVLLLLWPKKVFRKGVRFWPLRIQTRVTGILTPRKGIRGFTLPFLLLFEKVAQPYIYIHTSVRGGRRVSASGIRLFEIDKIGIKNKHFQHWKSFYFFCKTYRYQTFHWKWRIFNYVYQLSTLRYVGKIQVKKCSKNNIVSTMFCWMSLQASLLLLLPHAIQALSLLPLSSSSSSSSSS